MTAHLIVRAQLTDAALKNDFERWYQDEHLSDAAQAFGAKRAWRGWSQIDPLLHYAVYEFADLASARAIQDSPALKRLAADFDRAWGNRITRSRDVVEVSQSIVP
jgi:hypothetical protein